MTLRLIRSLWIWIACGLLFLIWVPVMAVVRLFDRDPLVLRTGRSLRLLGRLLIRVHLPTLHIAGLENIRPGQNYILVANHQSIIDIPLVSFLPLDTKCMAREDLFRLPWVGWTLLMSKEISINRKDPRNAARAMLQCVRGRRRFCSGPSVPFICGYSSRLRPRGGMRSRRANCGIWCGSGCRRSCVG